MKTEELIERMAAQTGKGWSHQPAICWAPVWVGLASTVALFACIFPLAPHASSASMPWPLAWRVPVLFMLALVLCRALGHLSRPALAWRVHLQPLLWVPIGLSVVALARIIWAHPQDRWAMIMGRSAGSCSLSIFLLSLPLLMGAMRVARQWVVTRPGLTGAVLGWSSASVAALIYTLHCTETEPAFVLLWYGLAVLLSGALGSYWGQRQLRC